MRIHRLPLLWLLLAVGASAAPGAWDEPLTPREIASIEREEAAAMKAIAARHQHRLPSQMSDDERRQVIAQEQQASAEVYARHATTAKAYARRVATLSVGEREQVRDALEQDRQRTGSTSLEAPAPEPDFPKW